MNDKIREVIVVEGKHDTMQLKRYFHCDTIETGGTSLSEDVIARIQEAQQTRGVIIFTDPDAPGNMIRSQINQSVPGCLNAYIDKEKAKTERKVGIEHAAAEDLQEALNNLVTFVQQPVEKITMADMQRLGLVGGAESATKRKTAGQKLHIGYANAKTFRARLNCLNMTKEEIERILEE